MNKYANMLIEAAEKMDDVINSDGTVTRLTSEIIENDDGNATKKSR